MKSFKQWRVAETSSQRINASFTKLNLLSQLAVLFLKVPDINIKIY